MPNPSTDELWDFARGMELKIQQVVKLVDGLCLHYAGINDKAEGKVHDAGTAPVWKHGRKLQLQAKLKKLDE